MVSDTVEILMWVAVYCTFMAVGYLFGRVKNYTARNDLKAKADMAEAKATHFEQLSEQSTAELLELQEDYQNLYRRDTKLRDGVKAHRAANNSNCNDLSCEKGCGHDLRLYKVLDETDASVAGLFPKLSVERTSVWDAMRDGLDEYPVEGIFAGLGHPGPHRLNPKGTPWPTDR